MAEETLFPAPELSLSEHPFKVFPAAASAGVPSTSKVSLLWPRAGRCAVFGRPGRRGSSFSQIEFMQKILVPVQPVTQPVIR